MTREEMHLAFEECYCQWPEYEFRGYNIDSVSERHKPGEYPKPRNRFE